MLRTAMVTATIPVEDIERAKLFYGETLALKLITETDNDAIYACGGDTTIYLYQRPPTNPEHTLAAFIVDDCDAAVQQLLAKGVTFEEYDVPGLKTVNYIAEVDEWRGAWFRDSEGNILGVSQDLTGRRGLGSS